MEEQNMLSFNIVWSLRDWSYLLMFKAHDLDTSKDTDMGDTFHFKFQLWKHNDPEKEEGEEGFLGEMNISSPSIEEFNEHAVLLLKKAVEMDPTTVEKLVKFAESTGAYYNPRIFSYKYE